VFIEVTGVDETKAFINTQHVAAIMPALDKGALIIGACIVFLAAGQAPPLVVKESVRDLANRIIMSS